MGCSESKHDAVEVHHADQRIRNQLNLAEKNMTQEQSKRLENRIISFKKFMSGDEEEKLNKSTDTEETEQESEDGATEDHQLFNEVDAQVYLNDLYNGEMPSNNSSLIFEHLQEPTAKQSPLREKLEMEKAPFDVVLYETAQITLPSTYQNAIASSPPTTTTTTTAAASIPFPPMHEEEEEMSGKPEPLRTTVLATRSNVDSLTPVDDVPSTTTTTTTSTSTSTTTTTTTTTSVPPPSPTRSKDSPSSLPSSPPAPPPTSSSEIEARLADSSSYSMATAMDWSAQVEEDEMISLQDEHGPDEEKKEKDDEKKIEWVDPLDTFPVPISTPIQTIATPVAPIAPVEQPRAPKSKQILVPRLTKASAARSAANNATAKATKTAALSASTYGGDKVTTPRQTAKPVAANAPAPSRVSQLSKTLRAAPAKPSAANPTAAVKPPLTVPSLKAVVSQAPKFKTKPFEKAAEPRCRF